MTVKKLFHIKADAKFRATTLDEALSLLSTHFEQRRTSGGGILLVEGSISVAVTPMTHEWELTDPGVYDSIYTCRRCKKRIMESHDSGCTHPVRTEMCNGGING